MSNYYLVIVYYQNSHDYDLKFAIDQLEEAKKYRDHYANKEGCTAQLYKICPELIE